MTETSKTEDRRIVANPEFTEEYSTLYPGDIIEFEGVLGKQFTVEHCYCYGREEDDVYSYAILKLEGYRHQEIPMYSDGTRRVRIISRPAKEFKYEQALGRVWSKGPGGYGTEGHPDEWVIEHADDDGVFGPVFDRH